jgi:hypothetical protein
MLALCMHPVIGRLGGSSRQIVMEKQVTFARQPRSAPAKMLRWISTFAGLAALGMVFEACTLGVRWPTEFQAVDTISLYLFVIVMVAINIPSILIAIIINWRCDVATGATLLIYQLLSCRYDWSTIADYNRWGTHQEMAYLLLLPILRPIPFVLLFAVGYGIDRFRNA